MSGISPASLSTLSAHTTCDSSSSAPTLAATLLPKSPTLNIVSSSKACFSAVVFSVVAFTGHRTSNAARTATKDFLLPSVRVTNHAAAGDFALSDNSKNRTLSASVRPVFMRIILSSRFIKSWGSSSSGFPVNEQLVMSAMSASSRRLEYGGTGEIGWLSCGVQTAGENVNWVDGVDKSVETVDSSSEVSDGEALRVEGKKRFSSSLSL